MNLSPTLDFISQNWHLVSETDYLDILKWSSKGLVNFQVEKSMRRGPFEDILVSPHWWFIKYFSSAWLAAPSGSPALFNEQPSNITSLIKKKKENKEHVIWS